MEIPPKQPAVQIKPNSFTADMNDTVLSKYTSVLFDPKTNKPVGGKASFTNCYIDDLGYIKRLTFKSFRGLIKELREINKSCRKRKYEVTINIKLPTSW